MPVVSILRVGEAKVGEFTVVLAAAGRSSRFGDDFQKKVFVNLAGKPLWMHSAEAFSKRPDVGQILLVIAAEDRDLFNEKFAGHAAMLGVQTVVGGDQRADSVRNALAVVQPTSKWVAVHDAARPCLPHGNIDAVFDAVRKSQAAILGLPCSATVKRVDTSYRIVETVRRDGLWLAQTPQCFDVQLLKASYAQHPNPSAATDEASIVEQCGHKVTIVEGSPLNIKVTTKADLKFAELAMKALPQPKPFPF